MTPLLANLSSSTAELVDILLARYDRATLSDFGFLAVAIVVSCWFVSKYSRE
jgi:hypothetical protein